MRESPEIPGNPCMQYIFRKSEPSIIIFLIIAFFPRGGNVKWKFATFSAICHLPHQLPKWPFGKEKCKDQELFCKSQFNFEPLYLHRCQNFDGIRFPSPTQLVRRTVAITYLLSRGASLFSPKFSKCHSAHSFTRPKLARLDALPCHVARAHSCS